MRRLPFWLEDTQDDHVIGDVVQLVECYISGGGLQAGRVRHDIRHMSRSHARPYLSQLPARSIARSGNVKERASALGLFPVTEG
jgi:hypothetical protein